jgi:hypothetical protein
MECWAGCVDGNRKDEGGCSKECEIKPFPELKADESTIGEHVKLSFFIQCGSSTVFIIHSKTYYLLFGTLPSTTKVLRHGFFCGPSAKHFLLLNECFSTFFPITFAHREAITVIDTFLFTFRSNGVFAALIAIDISIRCKSLEAMMMMTGFR